MANSLIEIKYDPPDLMQRFASYPQEFDRGISEAMNKALKEVQKKIGPYPPKREGQTYVRTGDLGRSLGMTMEGSIIGDASIMKTRRAGVGNYIGTIGSKGIYYNIYVIGNGGDQAWMHVGRWDTMDVIAKRAEPAVLMTFEKAMAKLEKWLEGR